MSQIISRMFEYLTRITSMIPEKYRPDFSDETDPEGHRKHFEFAAIYSIALPILMVMMGLPLINGILIAFASGLALIFIKEGWDMIKPNPTGFSWPDVTAGLMGLFGPLCVFIGMLIPSYMG